MGEAWRLARRVESLSRLIRFFADVYMLLALLYTVAIVLLPTVAVLGEPRVAAALLVGAAALAYVAYTRAVTAATVARVDTPYAHIVATENHITYTLLSTAGAIAAAMLDPEPLIAALYALSNAAGAVVVALAAARRRLEERLEKLADAEEPFELPD